MNTLTSYTTLSPYGKEEECAKFVIDTTLSPFILSKTMRIGQNYAFNCWLRSDSEGSVTITDGNFACSSEGWTKVSVKFTAESEDLPIYFAEVGTYYVYHAQLEIGTIITDWTPAIEDVADSIAEVEAQMGIANGEIWMEFDKKSEEISSVKDSADANFSQFYKHISFSENGIIIRNGDNTLTLTLDNTGIIFSKNGDAFGSWDGVDFYTGNIVVRVEERAQFGDFAFVPRSDGSLSFLKVGG